MAVAGGEFIKRQGQEGKCDRKSYRAGGRNRGRSQQAPFAMDYRGDERQQETGVVAA